MTPRTFLEEILRPHNAEELDELAKRVFQTTRGSDALLMLDEMMRLPSTPQFSDDARQNLVYLFSKFIGFASYLKGFQDRCDPLWSVLESWMPSPNVEEVLVHIVPVLSAEFLDERIERIIHHITSIELLDAVFAVSTSFADRHLDAVESLMISKMHEQYQAFVHMLWKLARGHFKAERSVSEFLKVASEKQHDPYTILGLCSAVYADVPLSVTAFDMMMEELLSIKDQDQIGFGADSGGNDEGQGGDDDDDDDDGGGGGSVDAENAFSNEDPISGGSPGQESFLVMMRCLYHVCGSSSFFRDLSIGAKQRLYDSIVGLVSLHSEESPIIPRTASMVVSRIMCLMKKEFQDLAPKFLEDDVFILESLQLCLDYLQYVDSSHGTVQRILPAFHSFFKGTQLWREVRSMFSAFSAFFKQDPQYVPHFLSLLFPVLSRICTSASIFFCGFSCVELLFRLLVSGYLDREQRTVVLRVVRSIVLLDFVEDFRPVDYYPLESTPWYMNLDEHARDDLEEYSKTDEYNPKEYDGHLFSIPRTGTQSSSDSEETEQDDGDDGDDGDDDMGDEFGDDWVVDAVSELQLGVLTALSDPSFVALLCPDGRQECKNILFLLVQILASEMHRESIFEADALIRPKQVSAFSTILNVPGIVSLEEVTLLVAEHLVPTSQQAAANASWDLYEACLIALTLLPGSLRLPMDQLEVPSDAPAELLHLHSTLVARQQSFVES
eukprot:ANDGO_05137.mRNA.1 hypothetical protein